MSDNNEKVNNIITVHLASHKVPQMVETKRDGYILFGEDNKYPDYLLQLFNRSSKHNAIITGKSNYIFGKGFSAKVENTKVKSVMESFNRNESMNEVGKKVITTMEIFDGVAMEIIWNRAGTAFEVVHLDFNNVRSNIDNSMFFYSTDWKQFGKPREVVEYKPFDPNEPRGKQLFYYKCYRPGVKTYPLPSYIGSIAYIETDIEIANYHLNNIKNNFWGDAVITFTNGIPTKEEQRNIKERFERQKTGTDNAGRFVIQFTDDPLKVPKIDRLTSTDSDKMFEVLNDTVLKEILIGHKVVGGHLFGIQQEGMNIGGEGGKEETLYHLFKSTYVTPRKQIVESIFNYFVELQTGVKDALELLELPMVEVEEPKPNDDPMTQVLENLNKLSPLVANEVLSRMSDDEVRALVKLKPRTQPTVTETPEVNVNPTEAKLSKESTDPDTIKSVLTKFGVTKDGKTVVRKRHFNVDKGWRFDGDEPIELSPQHQKILDLLRKNPDITDNELVARTKIQIRRVFIILDDLIKAGLVVEDNGTRTVTNVGKEISKEPKVTNKFVTYYEYVERPDAPDLKTESRPFCLYMMELNRYFTREDIDAMSIELGYDVWMKRGGWYHDPEKHVNLPFCRHTWNQVIVVEPLKS